MRFFQAGMLEEELYYFFYHLYFSKEKPLLLQKRRKYYNFHRSKFWNFCVEHFVTILYQRRLCLHFAFLCHSFIVFRLIQNFCLNRITSSAGVGPRYKKRIVSTVLDKSAFPLLITYLLTRVLVSYLHISFFVFPFCIMLDVHLVLLVIFIMCYIVYTPHLFNQRKAKNAYIFWP